MPILKEQISCDFTGHGTIFTCANNNYIDSRTGNTNAVFTEFSNVLGCGSVQNGKKDNYIIVRRVN